MRNNSLDYAREHYGHNRANGICEFCYRPVPEGGTLPLGWTVALGCPVCSDCLADAEAHGLNLATEYRGEGRSFGADPRLVRDLVREVDACHERIASLTSERDALLKDKDQLVTSFSRRIEELRKRVEGITEGDIMFPLREAAGEFFAYRSDRPSDEALLYMARKVALMISERGRVPRG